MDYVKIKFGNDIGYVDTKFENTVDDMFRSLGPVFRLSTRSWKPQMDIYETVDEITILAEIAGVQKEDLEVEIDSKAVKIQGFRSEMPVKNATYRLAEIQYGRFERILFLPAMIDTEKVSATYCNGFLKIQLAKAKRNKVFKIPISDG